VGPPVVAASRLSSRLNGVFGQLTEKSQAGRETGSVKSRDKTAAIISLSKLGIHRKAEHFLARARFRTPATAHARFDPQYPRLQMDRPTGIMDQGPNPALAQLYLQLIAPLRSNHILMPGIAPRSAAAAGQNQISSRKRR